MPNDPTHIAGRPETRLNLLRFAPDLGSQDFGVDPSAGPAGGNHGKDEVFPVRKNEPRSHSGRARAALGPRENENQRKTLT